MVGLSVVLSVLMNYVKRVLLNPYVIVGLLIVGALIFGRFWGKAVCQNEIQKEVVKEIKVYVKKKSAIEDKYRGNKFEAETILSGCVAETTKSQPHCNTAGGTK